MSTSRFSSIKKIALFGALFLLANLSPISLSANKLRVDLNVSYAQSASAPACTTGSYTQNTSDEYGRITGVYYYNTDGTQCTPSTQQQQGALDPTAPPLKGDITCSGFNFFTNFVTCGGRALSAIIGSALITVTAWLLEIAGVIFNWLVYYTVIQFGSFGTLNGATAFTNNISAGWGLFRDLSNIVMIGLFVFIAICTILGIKEYGYKKLVARVLIIAVLINFSLLFTKLIVDASNFTSYQFYTAAGLSGQSAGGSTPSTVTTNSNGTVSTALNFSQTGIAGQFLTYMGVTSIGQTYSTLSNGADSIQNGWIVLLHGLFSATMLLGAALVLLYGSFLLVARAITIIILMLTASIAFATHLLPALDKRGWTLWWQSLINAAIFAPILMIFLWMTIELAIAIKPSASGSLGDLLSNPTNGADLGSLFGYLMILGMLYASFKVSSMFASMAGSATMSIGTAVSPLAAPIGFAGTYLGKEYVRKPAAAEAVAHREAARRATTELRTLTVGTEDYNKKAAEVAKHQSNAEKAAQRAKTPPGGLAVGGAIIKNVFNLRGRKPPANTDKKDATDTKGAAAQKDTAKPGAEKPNTETRSTEKPASAETNGPRAEKPASAETNGPRAEADNAAKPAAEKTTSADTSRPTAPLTATVETPIEKAQRNAEADHQHEESEHQSELRKQAAQIDAAANKTNTVTSSNASEVRSSGAGISNAGPRRILDVIKGTAPSGRVELDAVRDPKTGIYTVTPSAGNTGDTITKVTPSVRDASPSNPAYQYTAPPEQTSTSPLVDSSKIASPAPEIPPNPGIDKAA